LKAMLVDGTRIALGLITGVTLAMLAFARPLVLRWMGPGFTESIPALNALAVAGIVLVAQGPLGNILLVVGRHRLVAFGSLAEALLNLGLSIFLVSRVGLVGAALGTMIAVVVFNLLVLLPIACRALEVPLFGFVRKAAAPALVASVPAAALALALRMYAAPTSLLAVLLDGGLVSLVYAAAFLMFGLDPADRRRYAQHTRRMRPGGRHDVAAAA